MTISAERSETRWRRCSVCKRDIALGAVHWVCSVSTCNRKRTALVFCDVDCWEVHPEMERHREAYAVEARAPKTLDPPAPAPAERKPRAAAQPSGASQRPGQSFVVRRTAASTSEPAVAPGATASSGAHAESDEILVVASRLKQYVKATSGFNTSDRVLPILSNALRALCDEAIQNALGADRQTVLDRDVPND